MSGKYATETLAADKGGIEHAAEILRGGGLIAVPTETVYGLAARADSDIAVAKIYEAKGRPSFNPLIVHVASKQAARLIAGFSPEADALADAHWPGPLTLVLPRRGGARLATAVTAGLETVALRVPNHPVMREILTLVDFPLAAPSANRSGYISPTCAQHVLSSLDGRIDGVIDGGTCPSGLESTIVAVRRDGSTQVLRPGPIEISSERRGDGATGRIEAPGQLASHYAPGKPVRLDAIRAKQDEFFIGFGRVIGDCSLSSSGSLDEAASRLYGCLHLGAASGMRRIAVAPVPELGIGRAINDRLRRAATPPD